MTVDWYNIEQLTREAQIEIIEERIHRESS